MKTICIFEFTYLPIDLSIDNMSGTQFRNNLIMKYYMDKSQIVYVCNKEIKDTNNIFKDVIKIPFIDYNDPVKFLDIFKKYNLNIDLVINSCVHSWMNSFILYLYDHNFSNHYLLLHNFWPYNVNDGWSKSGDVNDSLTTKEIYDKIIVINQFRNVPDKTKYINIQNAFYPNKEFFEDINPIVKKEHSLICLISGWRTSYNFLVNIIFKLVKARIPDFKIKFCIPNYNSKNDYPAWLINKFDTDNDFIFLGSLNQNDLKKELLKTPCSWRFYEFQESCGTGLYTELLCYCFPICDFSDAMRFNCSPEFFQKYSISDFRFDGMIANEIADRIIDVTLHYDKYVEDLKKEHDYVLNNFNTEIKIKEYSKVIDELL